MRISSAPRLFALALACGAIGEGSVLGVLVWANHSGSESSTLILAVPLEAALLGLAFGARAGAVAAVAPFVVFGVGVIIIDGGSASIVGQVAGGIFVAALLASVAAGCGWARERFARRR